MADYRGNNAADFDFAALPPEEAVEFFRKKGYQVGFDWRDVWQQEHQRAFTVAKAMTVDLLQDIRAVVDKAIAEGIDFQDFRENLEPILRARGWWGRQEMVDPLTGKKRDVQLGSARRLQIIYDTNLRTSLAAGHWQQIQRTKKDLPYLRYVDPDPNPRPQHLDWSGTILPVDDPWWSAHYPPNGYNCKCYADALSDDDLERYGFERSPAAPPSPTHTYTNPRTGQSYEVPDGVAPEFAYNVGETGIVEPAEQMLEAKLAAADPDIAHAVREMVAPSAALPDDAIARKLARRPEAHRIMQRVPAREWRAAWDYCTDSDPINDPWRRHGELTPQAKDLLALMGKLPRFSGVTWRGEERALTPGLIADLTPGSAVTPQAFWSTSRSRYRGRRFAGAEGILYELHGIRGRQIEALSPFPRQKEVLFDPWARFEVISANREGKILHVVIKEKP